MFVFYFAVLSEVTPPTALASVAASAITGGRVIPTMMQTWKYTLPAFLVPFAFVLTDNRQRLLGLRSLVDMVWTGAVGALAVVTGGWMIRRAGWPERVLCVPGVGAAALSESGDARPRAGLLAGGGGGERRHGSQTTIGITRSAASRYPRYGGYILISLGQ